MNCKPGDLAVVVSSRREEYIGKFIEVLRPYDGSSHLEQGPAWWVLCNGAEYHAADSCLRPIRDPGDDATDETLLWLPSPSREKEEA